MSWGSVHVHPPGPTTHGIVVPRAWLIALRLVSSQEFLCGLVISTKTLAVRLDPSVWIALTLAVFLTSENDVNAGLEKRSDWGSFMFTYVGSWILPSRSYDLKAYYRYPHSTCLLQWKLIIMTLLVVSVKPIYFMVNFDQFRLKIWQSWKVDPPKRLKELWWSHRSRWSHRWLMLILWSSTSLAVPPLLSLPRGHVDLTASPTVKMCRTNSVDTNLVEPIPG